MRRYICTIILAALLLTSVSALAYTDSMTEAEVVAFLEEDMRNHGKEYGAYESYSYVQKVFAKMGFKKSPNHTNSKEYWEELEKQGRTHGKEEPIPIGADLFFDNSSNWLMGIYIGSNTMITNRTKATGEYGVEKISLRDNFYKPKYAGWAWHDNVTIGNNLPISEANFPDDNFRDYISETFDENHDGELSQQEIDNALVMDCRERGIASLEGVGFFTELIVLDCSGNSLTSLDLSANAALTSLDCQYNDLMYLDVSENYALAWLTCAHNSLWALDVTNNYTLASLECDNNSLTALDLTNNFSLTELNCSDNSLDELDVSYNYNLEVLYCSNNPLAGEGFEGLDLSNCIDLKTLYCSGCSLTELDVSGNSMLTRLSCDENALETLDLSQNMALEALYCDENALGALDLSQNLVLETLTCNGNGLTALDVSYNPELWYLQCSNNLLEMLDVSDNPELEYLQCDGNLLTGLDVTENPLLKYLYCDGNEIAALDISNCQALVDEAVLAEAVVIDAEAGTFSYGDYEESPATVRCDLGVDLITEHKEYNTLALPTGLQAIMPEAFAGVAADVVEVPDGCTLIDEMAFAECENLTKIYIPASVVSIADDAFADSPRVRIVTDSDRLREWAVEHGILWIR